MLANAAANREVWRFLRFACLLSAGLSTVAAVTDWVVGLNPWWYTLFAALNLVGAHVAARVIRRCDRAALLALPEVQALRVALLQISVQVNEAVLPPMRVMVDALNGLMPAFNAMARIVGPVLRAQYPAGTVQNPADPSPRPRRVR